MKTKGIIISLFAIVFSCMILSSCTREEAITEPTPVVYEIAGQQVAENCTELDLRNQNILSMEPLYALNSLVKLDIRDNPVSTEDVKAYIKANPNCEVLWSIPLNGVYYDCQIDSLDLTQSDEINVDELIENLGYFKMLNTVQTKNSQISADDYKRIKKEYPAVDFNMHITIAQLILGDDETILDFTECQNVDQAELFDALKYFDSPKEVKLGTALSDTGINDDLLEAYPDTIFEYETMLLENVYLSTITELDISETRIRDLEAFKSQLKYFRQLTYIDMCDCQLKNEQMEELIAEYPDVKFVWKIKVGGWEMRTDITAFGTCYGNKFEGGTFTEGQFHLKDSEAANLKYLTDLTALDIGHQYGLTDYSFLAYMPDMEYLILAVTRHFEDMSLLKDMKNLRYLEIFTTNVSDVSVLPELENLEYLNCSYTPIPNADYLVELDNLKWLWFCLSDLSEEELTRLHESLPDCRMETGIGGATRGAWRSLENQGYVDMREALNMPLMLNEED